MTTKNENRLANWTRRSAIAGFAVAAIGAAGFATVANADDNRPSGGFFNHYSSGRWVNDDDVMDGRLNGILDRAGASNEQKRQIKAIMEKARNTIKDSRPQPGEMRDELATLMKAPTIDRSAVEALLDKRSETMQQTRKTMTTAFLDAAEVLTPEQRGKIIDAMQKRRPHS